MADCLIIDLVLLPVSFVRFRGTNTLLPQLDVRWVRLDPGAVRAVAGPARICFGW